MMTKGQGDEPSYITWKIKLIPEIVKLKLPRLEIVVGVASALSERQGEKMRLC